ncbi:hypothetical protein M8C21_027555 [Ambrosia artemisiifolia]|uniref:Uncharacterized protein n=1 Tax=Ambrosia artemisiifolia TaxID=4212 RepID=A0AAD5GRJ5_AMBAR|nr:hypothetical protein M8C21_027555 [Ambrosia artemisiifolia]
MIKKLEKEIDDVDAKIGINGIGVGVAPVVMRDRG